MSEPMSEERLSRIELSELPIDPESVFEYCMIVNELCIEIRRLQAQVWEDEEMLNVALEALQELDEDNPWIERTELRLAARKP